MNLPSGGTFDRMAVALFTLAIALSLRAAESEPLFKGRDLQGWHTWRSSRRKWRRIEARKVFPNRGRILHQCEGSEIFFRKVELLPLTKPD